MTFFAQLTFSNETFEWKVKSFIPFTVSNLLYEKDLQRNSPSIHLQRQCCWNLALHLDISKRINIKRVFQSNYSVVSLFNMHHLIYLSPSPNPLLPHIFHSHFFSINSSDSFIHNTKASSSQLSHKAVLKVEWRRGNFWTWKETLQLKFYCWLYLDLLLHSAWVSFPCNLFLINLSI